MSRYIVCLLMSMVVFPQGWASGVQVKVKVETIDSSKSERRELPHGDTRLTTEEQRLDIEVRRTNPTLPETLTVKWVVVGENMRGRTGTLTKGERTITTGFNVPAEFTSGSWTLDERNIDRDHRRKDIDLEQTIKGYGVFVYHGAQLLASKVNPPSAKDVVEKALEENIRDMPDNEGLPRRRRF